MDHLVLALPSVWLASAFFFWEDCAAFRYDPCPMLPLRAPTHRVLPSCFEAGGFAHVLCNVVETIVCCGDRACSRSVAAAAAKPREPSTGSSRDDDQRRSATISNGTLLCGTT